MTAGAAQGQRAGTQAEPPRVGTFPDRTCDILGTHAGLGCAREKQSTPGRLPAVRAAFLRLPRVQKRGGGGKGLWREELWSNTYPKKTNSPCPLRMSWWDAESSFEVIPREFADETCAQSARLPEDPHPGPSDEPQTPAGALHAPPEPPPPFQPDHPVAGRWWPRKRVQRDRLEILNKIGSSEIGFQPAEKRRHWYLTRFLHHHQLVKSHSYQLTLFKSFGFHSWISGHFPEHSQSTVTSVCTTRVPPCSHETDFFMII